jgi:hypothetical protein
MSYRRQGVCPYVRWVVVTRQQLGQLVDENRKRVEKESLTVASIVLLNKQQYQGCIALSY